MGPNIEPWGAPAVQLANIYHPLEHSDSYYCYYYRLTIINWWPNEKTVLTSKQVAMAQFVSANICPSVYVPMSIVFWGFFWARFFPVSYIRDVSNKSVGNYILDDHCSVVLSSYTVKIGFMPNFKALGSDRFNCDPWSASSNAWRQRCLRCVNGNRTTKPNAQFLGLIVALLTAAVSKQPNWEFPPK